MSLRLLANWKLHGSRSFYKNWFTEFNQSYKGSNYNLLGIAPPSIFIRDIAKYSKNLGISIGSQNIDQFFFGARTGEISSSMVQDAGGSFSITGHSERRILFNESDDDIGAKLDCATKGSLIPILCVGESWEQKNQHQTQSVLEKQVTHALQVCSKLHTLIIAYEPVWAIGSGLTPQSQEINSIHTMIKDVVQSRFSNIDLQAVIYGGSVNLENSKSIFKEKEIDGALIGGSSLNGEEFAEIANIFNDLKGL
jgi:triosephosphate isomerase